MENVLLRYQKKADQNCKILIPKKIIEKLQTNEFYIDLLDNNTIRLIPIKKGK